MNSHLEMDVCEIKLPGVKINHLKKAIKFLYTGQLKITKAEIDKEHIVWYIHHILMDLFKVDAKLNLSPNLLKPPPPDNDDPSPDGGSDNCDRNKNPSSQPSSSQVHNDNNDNSSAATPCDIDNTRQNKIESLGSDNQGTYIEDQINHLSPSEKDKDINEESSASNDYESSNAVCQEKFSKQNHFSIKVEEKDLDVDVLENERNVPTPDIIDLLDSDEEMEENNPEDLHEESIGPDCSQESLPDVDADYTQQKSLKRTKMDHEEKISKSLCVKRSFHSEEDLEGDNHVPVEASGIPPAKRKSTDKKENGTVKEKAIKNSRLKETISQPQVHKSSQGEVKLDILDISVKLSQINQKDSPTISVKPPNLFIAKKSTPKLKNRPSRSENSSKICLSGVRKHNHIPYTISGLKRADTFADIKQEKALHVCHLCNAKYEKFKSLKIHMGRAHNAKAQVPCPEGCGKMLTTAHAIKKHLLSHKPEEEWPYECPLCHKKFQARGDIPKHLMTKLHEKDNVPSMGTKGWYDLIYHDDPNYNYESHKVKLERMEAKGMQPARGATVSGGKIVIHDQCDNNIVTDKEPSVDILFPNSQWY